MMEDVPAARNEAPFVGRSTELAQLGTLIGLEPAGRPGHVLLSGDAGVGKSRLISELARRARKAGWRVLEGHCLDFGASGLAYLPFSEALGGLAVEDPELGAALVHDRPAISRLLPAQRVMAEAATRAQPTDRSTLFDAVHAGLEVVAAPAPLLFVVEDVQWADQSTRELLTFLFTRSFGAPVGLIASYRSDDLHRGHPLRLVLGTWTRLANVHRVEVSPLPDGDMRRLVRALRPDRLSGHELERLLGRAEGNPFFLEELVATVGPTGESIPRSLADVLLARLDHLDDDTRQAIRAVAAAGRVASHQLLSAAAGMDDERLDRALRAALEANVLVIAGSVGYAFRHALFAEAVYEDLLPGERTRLHAAYARALSSREVAGTAAELARHARAAHDLVTALRAGLDAADEAMAVGGPDEAAMQYEEALELSTDPALIAAYEKEHGRLDVVGIAEHASAAALAAGRPMRAVALAEAQLRTLPGDADPSDRGRLLLALATGALPIDTQIDLLSVTKEAVGLLTTEQPTPLQARALALHARVTNAWGHAQEAARFAGEALDMARRLGLRDVAVDAKTTLAHLQRRTGAPEAIEAALRQAVEESEAAGEVAAQLRGMMSLAGMYVEVGRLEEAKSLISRTWELARTAGRPWSPDGMYARAELEFVGYVTGDWDLVSATADTSKERPPVPELARAFLDAAALDVVVARGAEDAAEKAARVRESWHLDGYVIVASAGALIEQSARSGGVAAAERCYDEAVRRLGELWDDPWFVGRLRLGALLLGVLASVAARSTLAERRALHARGVELDEATSAVIASSSSDTTERRLGPEARAWEARARAEYARLRWSAGVDPPPEQELVELWRQAVESAAEFGHVYESARARAHLAEILHAAGRGSDAVPELQRAEAVAARLEASVLLGELRSLAALVGGGADTDGVTPMSGGGAGHVPDRNVPAPPVALTRREVDVLSLVAEGRSNGEIAQQLFISRKTVSVHVSNILAKLQAQGRTEAAAVARRLGLLADDLPS
jgi:DNA-binding CsgD family transcriptional regulator/tetratricopeptide (TPR) repeat protein